LPHERFKFEDSRALLEKGSELGLNLPFSENIDILFDQIQISGRKLKNRFIVHPMEGFDSEPDGSPCDLTFRRYHRFASGGSGLIWFEATAVLHEGRSNPRQLYINQENVNHFKRLVEETRLSAREVLTGDDEIILILQLTHSGRYSRPDGKLRPVIVHHSDVLDPVQNLPSDYPLISDDELDRLQEIYISAAELAQVAGFDGVDIKSCHGYIISELLGAFTRKDSRYGGSLENRSRFLIETARRIKEAIPKLIVTSRLTCFDGIPYPYGFGVDHDEPEKPDLSEPKHLIQELIQIGYPILNVTIGNPYYQPHLSRPYDSTVKGGSLPDEHPLIGINRFIQITSELQHTFPELPMVGTGYSWLRQFFPYVAAGVIHSGGATLIGQGRGAFAYPDSVKDLSENGTMNPHRVCVTCSGCTQIMRDGGRTGCVIRDSEIYGEES